MQALVMWLCALAALAAGLMAGVYYAFSAFIMRSFDQLGSERATDVMNAINEVILRSGFIVLFFASSLLFAVLAVLSMLLDATPDRWLLLAASLVYLAGMFGCTALFNVPLNNRLAESDNGEFWRVYYTRWTRWNHLRAISCIAAMLLCILVIAG